MSPELHSELPDLIHFAWASSLMHAAEDGVLLAALAAGSCPSTASSLEKSRHV